MAKSAIPRSEYPRPQFVRENWINLNGIWTYEFDPGKSGLERGLAKSKGFQEKILVPYCPESRLSGVAHTDFIEAMFYHRRLAIPKDWNGKRILLHFGAVDYACEAFIDGKSVGIHYGGTVSFFFDITDFVKAGKTHDLVLSVRDDQRSGVQPYGKQCGDFYSAGCSYTRTTGIWQTVWMEALAMDGLKSCRIVPDLDAGAFHFTPEFFTEQAGRTFRVTVSCGGRKNAAVVSVPANSSVPFTVELGGNVKPWSPENPFLYDIRYELIEIDGTVSDVVTAYAGLRKIHIEGNQIYLNNQRIFLRLVLDQGFYPEGIWTAPTDADLKKDIELSMAAGFNGARLHQKVFEERFHYWADKLGYLTWGESSSWGTMCFSGNSVTFAAKEYWQSAFNFMSEWRQIVERDLNHPSIIAWTPANETWIGNNLPIYRRLMTEIYDLTKSIDPTRPCNETSGYHHVKTDLWTVHLYCPDAKTFDERVFPKDKPVSMRNYDLETGYTGQPYLIDEIGGFMFIPPERQKFAENTWGYHGLDLKSGDELCAKIAEQIRVLLDNQDKVAGYCYTQLTDVEQEQNGVYNYDRTEKVPAKQLAAAFRDGKLIRSRGTGKK